MFKQYKLSDFINLYKDDLKFDNNTIFHNPIFLNYHKNKFDSLVLTYVEGNEIVAYITICVADGIAYSHKGSTYGGFVQLIEKPDEVLEEIIQNFFKELENLGINKFIVKFPPDIFLIKKYNQLNQKLKEKLVFEFSEETTFIDLENYDKNDLKKSNFRRGHISDINEFSKNKSINISKVNEDDELKKYYEVLQNNLQKFNKKPTHTFNELQYLIMTFPNQIEISILKVESKIIAGLTKFKLNDKTLHNFYSSMDYSISSNYRGALKFLYNYEMKNAAGNGFRYYNFGVDVHYGEKPNPNLRYFKLGFGGKVTTRDRYFKDL